MAPPLRPQLLRTHASPWSCLAGTLSVTSALCLPYSGVQVFSFSIICLFSVSGPGSGLGEWPFAELSRNVGNGHIDFRTAVLARVGEDSLLCKHLWHPCAVLPAIKTSKQIPPKFTPQPRLADVGAVLMALYPPVLSGLGSHNKKPPHLNGFTQ